MSSPDLKTLKSLLTNIPPKTLHSYTLARLDDAPPSTLATLSAFFATLAPPPRLHCVRCHQDFIEVENTERSCHVEHDDNSADIEWVGGRGSEEYEMHWGCCGQTVPGEDGDPPDGWCFEGKHTTDVKRARFREDSTPEEDMLVSCLELNCKAKSKPKAANKGKAKGKAKAKASDSGAEDGESSVGRAKSVKSATTSKQRGRPPKRKEAAEEVTSAGDKKKRKVVRSA